MNIDWSKAPGICIGATIAKAGFKCIAEGSVIWVYNILCDRPFVGIIEKEVVFAGENGWPWIPRSAQWNCEGRPPIGTVCEWAGCTFAPEDPKEPDLHVGDQVKIIAHFKDGELDLAAFTFNPQIHNPDRGTAWVGQGAHGCFRPFRTPEQIAAEERDKRLVAMTHAYQDITGESPSNAAHQAFRALDLAGYRKFEIVDGE